MTGEKKAFDYRDRAAEAELRSTFIGGLRARTEDNSGVCVFIDSDHVQDAIPIPPPVSRHFHRLSVADARAFARLVLRAADVAEGNFRRDQKGVIWRALHELAAAVREEEFDAVGQAPRTTAAMETAEHVLRATSGD
jgi:hypothetical protein